MKTKWLTVNQADPWLALVIWKQPASPLGATSLARAVVELVVVLVLPHAPTVFHLIPETTLRRIEIQDNNFMNVNHRVTKATFLNQQMCLNQT